jgi:hypothetical protein
MGGRSRAPAPTPAPAVTQPKAVAPMNMVPDTIGPQQFITSDGGTPSNQYEFIKESKVTDGAAVPGLGDDDLTMVLGGEGATQMFSPFDTARAGASFLGDEYASAAGLPRMEATVPNQSPGAVGEGGEGFGSRALAGGVDGTIENPLPEGSMEQTDVVGTEMASDVATTNEQPLPGQALNNDVNYRMSAGTGFGGGLGGYNLGYGPQSLRAGNFGRNLLGKREAGFASKYG